MKTTAILYLSFLISFTGLQANAETTRQFLRKFHDNPAMMMQRLPSEVLSDGSTRERGFISDSAVAKAKARHEEIRTRVRRFGYKSPRLMTNEAPTEEEKVAPPKDLAAKIVEDGAVTWNLPALEAKKLLSYKLETQPWPGSYWPLYKGMTGVRFADPGFPNSKKFVENRDYVLSRPALAIWNSGDQSAINKLSPSEKYDLAVGDHDLTLTQYAWAQGNKQLESYGSVATWMGICHGWAGASHMGATFPDHPIVVQSVEGRPITFYPDDVKGLQSMLWANAAVSTRFVGSRCDVFKPARNANGRILDRKCFDIDPGTWHLAIVNQLGANKRSFVMDSTYDLEVWNYPLFQYKITYFNPQTWQDSTWWKKVAVRRDQYKLDKFPEFRDQNTQTIVGVVMDVTFADDSLMASTRAPSLTPTKTLRFIYDLELDGDSNIIGGEWYSNAHPDFIWSFAKDAQAYAIGEGPLKNETWTINEPVPSSWTDFARKGSARGEPLFAFVGKLALEPVIAPPPETPPIPAPPVP